MIPNNSQLFSLRTLPGVERWLPMTKFKSPINACSWMKSANTSKEKLTVYHYRKESDYWTCDVCKKSVSNVQLACCRRPLRSARQVQSDYDTDEDDTSSPACQKKVTYLDNCTA